MSSHAFYKLVDIFICNMIEKPRANYYIKESQGIAKESGDIANQPG